jgi:hypothetical protein
LYEDKLADYVHFSREADAIMSMAVCGILAS